MEELIRYMRALVLLQVQESLRIGDPEHSAIRPEVLLADAGFSAREIADMVAKTPAAVAKAISRGRTARRKGTEPSEPSMAEGERPSE
jgi:DNA-directed RNA polymerase specialized sigma24 family protein